MRRRFAPVGGLCCGQLRSGVSHLTVEENKMANNQSSGATKNSGKRTASRKSADRKYSPSVGKDVETEIRAMKRGMLKSGRRGKKVTNPKQAIAIGLSKARKEGKKVPAKTS
jgi:hypothetical protein